MTVGEHFALEAATLRPLPAEPFDVRPRSQVPGRRASPGSVCASASTRSRSATPADRLDVRLGAETVEVLDGGRLRRLPRAGARQRRRESSSSTTTSRSSRSSRALCPARRAFDQARASGAFSDHPRAVLGRGPPPPRRRGRDQGADRGAARCTAACRPRRSSPAWTGPSTSARSTRPWSPSRPPLDRPSRPTPVVPIETSAAALRPPGTEPRSLRRAAWRRR